MMQDLLQKISPTFLGKTYLIPESKRSPEERQRQRTMFRNERKMYHRKCSKTGRQMISMYRPETPFPVYAPDVWFGDSWDARDYGQDFDFTRPFFEQFKELQNKVPHLALISKSNDNCDYCNIVGDCKDCYLIFGSIKCRDCYYGSPFNSTDCGDSLLVRNSELCCECTDSSNLYNCYQCQNCSKSQNLKYCFSVENSSDCFGCVGLSHKQFHILNQPYSKDAYEERVRAAMASPENVAAFLTQFEALKKSVPHRATIGLNNENIFGDYVTNSKDCTYAFNVEQCQDVHYGSQLLSVKDAVDVDYGEIGELLYDVMGFYNNFSSSAFCYWCWDNVSNLYYCANCTQSVQNCFGCVGLKRAEYCILNKQYTKEAYEKLVPKIIEHMKKTGEFGEFFPASISPFAYNETVAQEYYPRTPSLIREEGLEWLDDETKNMYRGPEYQIPWKITDVKDGICKEILICETTQRPYRIIPQELALYRRMNIPIPRVCPDLRHANRLAKRNPRKLWERSCAKCGATMASSHALDRPETIYCEQCYRDSVY